ncbi:Dna2/Cas4 domain-containing protein [Sulfurisphaera ohwakuensis]|uniref:Dna2/Cas4 domain-containing protein n=1 Tax=Sulfurisphaera ohwakuensis TaxID=69656 RepID=UPI0036F32CEE
MESLKLGEEEEEFRKIPLKLKGNQKFKSRLLREFFKNQFSPVLTSPRVIWLSELLACPRRVFLLRHSDFHKELLHENMKQHIGIALHYRIQVIAKQYGFEAEKRIEKQINGVKVVGKIDLYDPTEDVAYEMKYSYQRGLPKAKLEKYKKQLQYYLDMAGIAKGYLLVFHSNGFVREFEVERARTDFEERAIELANYLENSILPPRKPKPDFECHYCQFFISCWSAKKKLKGVKEMKYTSHIKEFMHDLEF